MPNLSDNSRHVHTGFRLTTLQHLPHENIVADEVEFLGLVNDEGRTEDGYQK